jgi:hypothetical protein
MQAFELLAFYLTDRMAELLANRYSEFWILSPGFYYYIISAETTISDPDQRTRFLSPELNHPAILFFLDILPKAL